MATDTSPKPRIYYGWFILASCFIFMAIGMSARNAFGLFLKPMIEDFQLSRAAVSLPVSLSLILYGVSQPIGGLLIRRYGARTVIIWGAALTCLGILGMSTVRSIWGVYFFFGLLVGMGGVGNSFTAYTPLVTSWFQERRGTALSIVSSGTSVGQLTLLPLFAFLIAGMGWRQTFLVTGAAFTLVMLPLALFALRDQPTPGAAAGGASAHPSAAPYDLPWAQCLHKTPFVLLAASFFTCGFTVTVMGVHWVPFATDVGFPAALAATAFALGGGLNTVGSLVVGPLSDKLGRKVPLSWVYMFRGVGFFIFIFFKNDLTVWLVPMMIGLTWIATVPLTAALTGDFFGPRNVAVLFGLVSLSHQLGAGLAAWLAGYIYDVTGSYNIAFALAGYLCFQAALLVSLIKESEVHAARAAETAAARA
ncbi:MAG: MFS transporter [Candidatus Tectomicrobia bacterium]|nr:MFS transporter [Candidatus Tectomicrobia bacterium]